MDQTTVQVAPLCFAATLDYLQRADRLKLSFGSQYTQEISFLIERETAVRIPVFILRLPTIVEVLNGEITRLTGKTYVDAVRAMFKRATSATSVTRPIGLKEKTHAFRYHCLVRMRIGRVGKRPTP
ncbi:hypothetical protein CHS0354_014633 [Potamilus streckersoni]|uniref:Uncharacterized protein n=1 Tax=Potamilus streckersoni TaxID=2493646 RepID=A0AAE0W0H6_9BIVA|nr:hypothetical protein CHS0354_014633 [Potamilus streckersoni]